LEPIIENPFGVHDHDILSGRGAFVNGHIGNARLRTLASERKIQFDSGGYTEKRALATEIVQIIKALDPPGRFLKRSKKNKPEDEQLLLLQQQQQQLLLQQQQQQQQDGQGNMFNLPPRGLDGTWEELSDEKSIHKACQVMRDIDRPDRKDRELRRAKKKQKLLDPKGDEVVAVKGEPSGDTTGTTKTTTLPEGDEKDSKEEETTAEKAAVKEAIAATEEALDKALDAVPDASKVKTTPAIDGETVIMV
jgi:hypothetical protein